jgi:Domain of unknown function (DUF4399)
MNIRPIVRRSLAAWFGAILAIAAVTAVADAGQTPSAPGAKVYFVDPHDGDVVTSPFTVHFGVTGMTLAPAGTQTPNSGHHHLFIDTTFSPGDADRPIPMDSQHLHFGKAQTEAVINLPQGTHTLQLVLGDYSHIPHNPPVVSQPITITVR